MRCLMMGFFDKLDRLKPQGFNRFLRCCGRRGRACPALPCMAGGCLRAGRGPHICGPYMAVVFSRRHIHTHPGRDESLPYPYNLTGACRAARPLAAAEGSRPLPTKQLKKGHQTPPPARKKGMYDLSNRTCLFILYSFPQQEQHGQQRT